MWKFTLVDPLAGEFCGFSTIGRQRQRKTGQQENCITRPVMGRSVYQCLWFGVWTLELRRKNWSCWCVNLRILFSSMTWYIRISCFEKSTNICPKCCRTLLFGLSFQTQSLWLENDVRNLRVRYIYIYIYIWDWRSWPSAQLNPKITYSQKQKESKVLN